jgi:nucleotide-binding universal stress UspA family protein
MNGGVHPIVVGVDGSAAGAVAQRWAMTEAIAHQLPVRLVCAYTWGVKVGATDVYADDPRGGLADLRDAADRVIDSALTELKELERGLEVSGEAIEGAAAEVLRRESESAATLVVTSAVPEQHPVHGL